MSTPIQIVRRHLQQYGAAGWEEAWKEDITPWDANGVQPALLELLERAPELIPNQGHALVAGCGRGYDAYLFATKGLDATGVDISTSAVEAAQTWLSNQPAPPRPVTFKEADFFNFDGPPGSYDLAYDYTFCCALNPAMRQRWAERYAQLVKPRGILITLIYPIDGPRQDGPPFSLSVEVIQDLLRGEFERVYLEKPTRSTEGHKDREMVAVWRRRN